MGLGALRSACMQDTYTVQVKRMRNAQHAARHVDLDRLVTRQSVNTPLRHEVLRGKAAVENLQEHWDSWTLVGDAVHKEEGRVLGVHIRKMSSDARTLRRERCSQM